MKALIVCLVIVAAAAWMGRHQSAQIVELERKVNAMTSLGKFLVPDGQHIDLVTEQTGKPRVRPIPPSAEEVYRTILELVNTDPRAIGSGSSAVIENKEALAAMMRLDLAGQQELASKIRNSDDSKFSDDIYRWEMINTLLCAMADRHPQAALELFNQADDGLRQYFDLRKGSGAMLHYLSQRLIAVEPIVGMDALVESAIRNPHSWSGPTIADAIGVEGDLELVMQTIVKFPEDRQFESWQLVVERADTAEKSESVFGYLRKNPLPDRAKMADIIGPLMRKMREEKTGEEFAGWIEQMKLLDEERIWAVPTIEQE